VNLDQCRIVLRPRSVSEVLDLGLRVISGFGLRLYTWLSVLFLLPCLAGCLTMRYVFEAGWEWVWLAAFASATVFQGVFTIAVGRFLFAEDLTVREVVKHFGRRFFSYFGALFVSRLLLGLGALLGFFVFPLFWAWTKVAFVHEASLLEQASPGEAVKRASRFVASRSSSTFLLTLWFLLAHTAFALVFEAIGNFGIVNFLLQLGEPFGTLADGGSPFALLGFFLSVPYVATARFLAYVDTRTRMDGWDIQLKFMAISARERPSPRQEAA
jgi:hypothetical protein